MVLHAKKCRSFAHLVYGIYNLIGMLKDDVLMAKMEGQMELLDSLLMLS